jgi:hypothetical protein
VNFLVAFGFGVLGTVGYLLFGREPLSTRTMTTLSNGEP